MPPKPIITTTPPTIPDFSVQFNTKKFEGLIWDKGYEAYIDKAVPCPCRQEPTGNGLPDCTNCLGSGWVFFDRTSTKIISQSMNFNKRIENWGENTTGIAHITSRGIDRLAYMDKITLPELDAIFSQVLFPALKNGVYSAFSIYEPKSIDSIFLFVSSDKKLLRLDSSQYSITDNKFTFADSLKSKFDGEKMKVSVRYFHYPTYHVIDVNRELMKVREKECKYDEETLKQMPVNCLVRKAHFILDEIRNNNKLQENSKTI